MKLHGCPRLQTPRGHGKTAIDRAWERRQMAKAKGGKGRGGKRC